MTAPWAPDAPVDLALAERLVAAELPYLQGTLRPLGQGWDNTVFRAGPDDDPWVLRFPHRQVGADVLAIELRWLPVLCAAELGLAIPRVRHEGRPGAGHPYAWAGYHEVPGRTACGDVQAMATVANAHRLGDALGRLHGLPVPADAPGDTLRKADLAHRLPQVLAMLERVGPPHAASLADRAVAWVTTSAHAGGACWVHGDLYARHLIVDATHRLTGLIDFGDVHAGDPALDVAAAVGLFGPDARRAFAAAYRRHRPLDAALWRRARFRALFSALALLDYGAAIDDAPLVAAGRWALDHVRLDSPAP